MAKRPEDILQQQVVEYLRRQYPDVLFTSTLGGLRLTIGQAVKAKRQGYLKGVPDLLIFEYKWSQTLKTKMFTAMFLELKSDIGLTSPEQVEVMKRLHEQGWSGGVAKSFAQAKALIDEYLAT